MVGMVRIASLPTRGSLKTLNQTLLSYYLILQTQLLY